MECLALVQMLKETYDFEKVLKVDEDMMLKNLFSFLTYFFKDKVQNSDIV